MLKVIQGSDAFRFPYEMDAMFRNRKEIFADRLEWDVTVENGWERDVFDEENPVYLVSLDPSTRRYRGSVRLLPTTGPNMLRDVFPFLLDEGETVESQTIWEISRICTAPQSSSGDCRNNGLNDTFAELILGIVEVGLNAGLTQIVAVFDTRVYRMVKAVGCDPQLIGQPQMIGSTMSYVGVFDTGNSPLRKIRRVVGIQHSVLTPEIRELAAA